MTTQKLYHYTSAPALTNILNTGYLRATQAWHLADATECRMALQSLQAIRPHYSESKFWRSVENTLLTQPRYVVCFSKIRNDPYQWKNYGADGIGACLVLDPQLLKLSNPSRYWDDVECIYDAASQEQFIQEFAERVDEWGVDDFEDTKRLNDFWRQNIAFKAKEFYRENEVRYVLSTKKGDARAQNAYEDRDASPMAGMAYQYLNQWHHPSGFFDQLSRPFEPFEIEGAISEIILGPRFTATLPYFRHLEERYRVLQVGTDL